MTKNRAWVFALWHAGIGVGFFTAMDDHFYTIAFAAISIIALFQIKTEEKNDDE